MKVVMLGAGLIGRAMAVDLALQGFEVLACDVSQKQCELTSTRHENISGRILDVTDIQALEEAAVSADLFINAVPGFLGYRALENIIPFGLPVVDIAFYPENPFGLNELAKKHGVPLIVDCGVAPGLSNFLIGNTAAQLDSLQSIEVYVGGLPIIRSYPLEYRTVFSPVDVIEEYVRPARLVENGKIVIKEALSEAELMEFEGAGTLEAFNTDGLRTIADTMTAPFMKEKTLRYPGHIEKINVLKKLGFFDTAPRLVSGHEINPRELTSQLLFENWNNYPESPDLTVLRVVVEGTSNSKTVRYQYDMVDRYDSVGDVTSMARTTGYTATAAATLFSKGLIKETGVLPPENLGRSEEVFSHVMDYLAGRNVRVNCKITEL